MGKIGKRDPIVKSPGSKTQEFLAELRKKKKKKEKKTTWLCDLTSKTNPGWNVTVVFRQTGKAHVKEMPALVESTIQELRAQFGREPMDLEYLYAQNPSPEGKELAGLISSVRKKTLQDQA